MLPTMGPVRLRRLLEVFREPERVLAARRDELRRIEGIGNEVAGEMQTRSRGLSPALSTVEAKK